MERKELVKLNKSTKALLKDGSFILFSQNNHTKLDKAALTDVLRTRATWLDLKPAISGVGTNDERLYIYSKNAVASVCIPCEKAKTNTLLVCIHSYDNTPMFDGGQTMLRFRMVAIDAYSMDLGFLYIQEILRDTDKVLTAMGNLKGTFDGTSEHDILAAVCNTDIRNAFVQVKHAMDNLSRTIEYYTDEVFFQI